MRTRIINKHNFFSILGKQERPWQEDYLAMYSSLWDAFTTDPDLMMVPLDDHLVHRGDGVFEVMRCVNGKIYQMDAHLERLGRSAGAISLKFPLSYDDLKNIIKELVLLGGEKECLLRLVLARGPGSFTTNPFDCPSSQIYANLIRFKPLPEVHYREGVSLITSHIPIKKSFFANIKSCNYLQNVLMKKEAIEAGCHYSVALDEEGYLAEGSTENVGLLSAEDILKFPGYERTLSGITATRAFELAHELVKGNLIKGVVFARIPPQEAYEAKEVFLTGTSMNVLPVTAYDGRSIGNGKPGPVYSELFSLLWRDMTENTALLTEIDW